MNALVLLLVVLMFEWGRRYTPYFKLTSDFISLA